MKSILKWIVKLKEKATSNYTKGTHLIRPSFIIIKITVNDYKITVEAFFSPIAGVYFTTESSKHYV